MGALAVPLGAISGTAEIADGWVIPASGFIAHCQQAGVAPAGPMPVTPEFAARCQTAIQQIAPTAWVEAVTNACAAADLGVPLLLIRPSLALPLRLAQAMAANDLLMPRICAVDELATNLLGFWAAVFAAPNLLYWQSMGLRLDEIPLATLVQPLPAVEQSGHLWVTEQLVVVEQWWGMQLPDAPQETEGRLRVLDRRTGRRCGDRANPQQVVHTVLGHWPQALPRSGPLVIPDNQWLVPHEMPTTEGDERGDAGLEDQQFVDLVAALMPDCPPPWRVDWHFVAGRLLVQAMYPEELPPGPLLAAVARGCPVAESVDAIDQTWVTGGIMATPGVAVGRAVVVQANRVLLGELGPDSILVTSHLSPEWLPLIRPAVGLVTEIGGMTSHGAVLARSLGIPAIVGATDITQQLHSGQWLKLEAGQIQILGRNQALEWIHHQRQNPPVRTARSVAQPALDLYAMVSQTGQVQQLDWQAGWRGIGLVRGEHLLASALAPANPWQPLSDADRWRLSQVLLGQLKLMLETVPGLVGYRVADWRGGDLTQAAPPVPELNPALGRHGMRHYQERSDWLDLELQTIVQLSPMLRSRLRLLLPFVRSVAEVNLAVQACQQVGVEDVALWVMLEVPALLYQLPQLAAAGVKGVTIGLNDLLQLLFAADREQVALNGFFDLNDLSVQSVLRSVLAPVIKQARELNLACMICSVPPQPEFVAFLRDCGVTGMVVNPGELAAMQALLT